MGEPDAHVARQLVLGKQVAQLDRELVGVRDLAVDDEPDRQRVDDRAPYPPVVRAGGLQDDDRIRPDIDGDGGGRPPHPEAKRRGRELRGNPHS